jgi:protein TonB
MPLHLALLMSFTLHAALIVVPSWQAARLPPSPLPSIEARLLPLTAPQSVAEAVSTESSSVDAIPEQHAAKPRSLHDASLLRAQTALSKHLFYPPQAVAMGLEGEVILLLSLSESGQLVSATIARSSGHAMLDQAALDAARRIGALPGNPRQVLFPVNFRLQ